MFKRDDKDFKNYSKRQFEKQLSNYQSESAFEWSLCRILFLGLRTLASSETICCIGMPPPRPSVRSC